ncbi:MAG: hypothetical protein IPM52_10515 [Bacteroidetes bacterium]|nr:hypothetical protein [Bacteroidota bacterium]
MNFESLNFEFTPPPSRNPQPNPVSRHLSHVTEKTRLPLIFGSFDQAKEQEVVIVVILSVF